MEKFNKVDDSGFINFEKNFFTTINLVAAIISFIGIISNFLLDLRRILVLIPIIAFIFYFTVFYISKKKKTTKTLKWVTSIVTLIILNLLWYYNYGFKGPAPYFFVIVYSLLIYVWHRKELVIFTIIVILNLLVIFYIDLNYPDLTGSYSNIENKVMDIYIGIFFYIALLFIVISEAKESYIREYRKAKESEMLKSSFLANMSHEIRTPLNAIVGFSNLLADNELPSHVREEYKLLVEENNNQLLRLITDILDISKIESNQLTLKFTDVNVNNIADVLEQTFKKSEKKLTQGKIKFTIKKYKQDFTIETDESRLIQILSNLISNAFKFTEEGEIKLSITIESNKLIFEVTDTGIGINELELERIFDRFYRIDNNKSPGENHEIYRGTGLGLYLSKNLAELLGGNLWAFSEKGKGSVFYLSLPLKNYKETSKEKPKKISKTVTNDKIRDLKIMVVEDDSFNQLYFKELFNRFKIKITIAGTGEEALEIIERNPDFDIVFLDIKLPGIDGFEVLKRVKKLNIKTLMVAQTANVMEGDKIKCLNAGFDKYLSKPIKRSDIQKILTDYTNT